MCDRGSRPERHLAMGGTGRPHKNKIAVVTFVRSVFHRSFSRHVIIIAQCGSIHLVGEGALILVCELGRLLPETVFHTEVRDHRVRGGITLTWGLLRWKPEVGERRNLSNSAPLTLYSTKGISQISHTAKCYQVNNSFIVLWYIYLISQIYLLHFFSALCEWVTNNIQPVCTPS